MATGMGQISLTGQLITKQFGVRQALGLITTDLEIEPNELFTDTLCEESCTGCASSCPMDAIDIGSVEEREVCGIKYKVACVDRRKCRYCPNGAFPDTTSEKAEANRCTAACTRNCIDCLEAKGIGVMKTKFRREKPGE